MADESDIILLYAYLEKIAQKKDLSKNDLDEVKYQFDIYLKCFEQEPRGEESTLKLRYLKSKPFIEKITLTEEVARKVEYENLAGTSMNGDSLLLRAMSIKKQTGSRKKTLDHIIRRLIKCCPDLIYLDKCHDKIKGVSPLHIAVMQEDLELLERMAKAKKNHDFDIEHIIGNIFQDTVMMAGTLVGIASLTCNEKLFQRVLKYFDLNLTSTNEKGDTIIHSMIKYAHIRPEKLDAVIRMLSYIIDYKFITKLDTENENDSKYRNQVLKMLMMKNKEKLTPLQLAAKRQQFEIFDIIISHEIYLLQESTDSLYNEKQYDITEIETFALEDDVNGTHEEDIKKEHHESVLEYVVHHKTNNAIRFTNVTPVKDIIREKWNYYRCPFRIWFGFYFSFMVLLSSAAVERSNLKESVRSNDIVQYKKYVTKDPFVTFVSGYSLLFAIVFLVVECRIHYIKRFRSTTSTKLRKRLIGNFCLPYKNFTFRVYFIMLAFLLIFDFVFAVLAGMSKVPTYENYCLIFAIIIGWYLVLFFLQVFKSFSFYTVLIQRVILDMIKFACVMLIFLIAFSIAVYMIMQGADTEEDDFDNLGKTIVKMLTIMLGIGEIGVLFQARQPILAVIVFVLFVLLTTILLLNALIAMMSNSCTYLTSNGSDTVATTMHYRLQKVSIILFLESFLPLRFCKHVGNVRERHMYTIKDMNVKEVKKERRRIWTQCSINEHDVQETEFSDDDSLRQIDKTSTISSIMLQHMLEKTKQPHTKRDYHSTKISQLDVPAVQKRIEIKDIARHHCEQCRHGSVAFSQSTDIVENLVLQPTMTKHK